MKSNKISIWLTALALTCFATTGLINIKYRANSKPDTGFAVIELFTSEGCSSCPPADDLVAKIQKEYNNQPVYILAFHVDYWNRLGWKDNFSSADYSQRQWEYVKYLRTTGAYTPQIVVNGKKEFVGSEEETLRNAIKTGLQKAPSAQLTLSDIKIDQHKVTLHYQAEGTGNNSVLLLALVERSAQTSVKAGENKGRNLSHVQIVRALQKAELNTNKSGTEKITLPNGFNPQGWEIIGIVQNTATGEITGAAKATFPVAS